MFDSQRNALAVSKTPWLGLEGARNLPDGMDFDFVELDLTGENLALFLSLGPGRQALTSLPVSITVTSTTWGAFLSPCKLERYLPCDKALTDSVVVSNVNITWSSTSFSGIPEATIPNDVVHLYAELRRADNTGPRIAGGVFSLTETNYNGDP